MGNNNLSKNELKKVKALLSFGGAGLLLLAILIKSSIFFAVGLSGMFVGSILHVSGTGAFHLLDNETQTPKENRFIWVFYVALGIFSCIYLIVYKYISIN